MTTAVEAPAVPRHRGRWLGLACLSVLGALALGAGALYGDLPSVSDAQARVRAELAAHQAQVVPIRPNERIARAVVAIEDHRFFHHGAVDPIAIGRVVVRSLTGGSADPGGSTIAQQLAKVLYREPEDLLGQLRAIGLAFKLEASYTKPAILSMYLNAVYFGHQFYGIGAASRGYFGRRPARLNWAQATLLAGLPQAPSAYDPLVHLALARQRQREVLDQLVAQDVLSSATADRIRSEPLGLR